MAVCLDATAFKFSLFAALLKIIEDKVITSYFSKVEQGGASYHTVSISKAWFRHKNTEISPSWPSQSQDLNPIDTLERK